MDPMGYWVLLLHYPLVVFLKKNLPFWFNPHPIWKPGNLFTGSRKHTSLTLSWRWPFAWRLYLCQGEAASEFSQPLNILGYPKISWPITIYLHIKPIKPWYLMVPFSELWENPQSSWFLRVYHYAPLKWLLDNILVISWYIYIYHIISPYIFSISFPYIYI